MTAIEIEHDIAIPTVRWARYPFRDMKVGDSFAISIDAGSERIRAAASAYGRNHGRKYTVRTLPHEIRCWRIA